MSSRRERQTPGWLPGTLTDERGVSACSALMGWAWLGLGAGAGLAGFLWALLPGTFLVVGGLGGLCWPGDVRSLQYAAAAALVGAFAGVPAMLAIGPGTGLGLAAGSALVFLLIGAHGIRVMARTPRVPDPEPSAELMARVALDAALLGWLKIRVRYPAHPSEIDRIGRNVERALEFARAHGFDSDPAGYLREPSPPSDFEIRARKLGQRVYEHLRFESAFDLREGEPDAAAYCREDANRFVHAWVLRHAAGDRPWMIGIHGYRLGFPVQDFVMFPPRFYHEELGLNVALCVLPMHGPRKLGWWSGDGFLDGDPVRTLYAEAQANWDLRRLIGWIRQQGGEQIGAIGKSLGAYSAALLAGTSGDVRFAILGTPPADLARVYLSHGPPDLLHRLADAGVDAARLRRLFRPISPLALPARVPREGRMIYAGVVDRVVPPEHARDLCEHWEAPRMVWYQGGHLPEARAVQAAIRETIRGVESSGRSR